jgi:C4-dicarboxylate transporter DctM subunit
MTLLLLLSFVVFLALNIPIAFSLLLSSILYLLAQGDVPLIAVAQRLAAGTDHYLLLAIPFFFLAAEIMSAGGIMDRLARFATVLVGHIRGGLGQVNVVNSMLFAGISGSAVADAASMGRFEVEMMHRAGYDKAFSAVITGASATVGPIIPPSIPFVVYASIASVSVGGLFLAGIVPGLLLGLFLMVTVYIIAGRRNYPRTERPTFSEALVATWRAIPILLLPGIILGGILSGVFTPTEAATVAAFYAFVLCKFLLRSLHWKEVLPVLQRVGTDTAKLMFIIASGSLFSWILAREGVPQALAATFLSVSREPWAILGMMNLLLLFLGCFLEPIVVLILIVPILAPVVQTVGIDLIHFGVVVTLNLMIGLITPPVGTVMFVLMGIADISMEEFVKAMWPLLAALLLLLVLITYVPAVVLFLPRLVMG